MAKDYTNKLSKEKRERLFNLIQTDVIICEGYLKAGFSTKDIADKHSVSRQDLSAVVSYYFNENFSQLLQRLRVNRACKKLTDKANAGISCEMIGLKCGFANRQSFYNAFLRIKGITPQEYRNKHTE